MGWREFMFRLLSIVATLSFSLPVLAAERVLLDQLEASVNASTVFYSDVKKFRDILKLRAQLDPLFANHPIASQKDSASTASIVDFLVDEKLIALHFPKSDNDVEQEINSIQHNNRLDRPGLKEALKREGFQFSDYFELIRSSGSKRDLIDREIRTKVTISDDDIQNYFYNHYARSSSTPRAYHMALISISEGSFKNTNGMTAAALAAKAAQQAYKDLKKGEAFDEVAKRVNDDGSASSGGDLGVMTEDQMSPMIRDKVKKLKAGEISDVFGGGTSKRYHILKLVDVKVNDSEQLNKMKDEIRGQLATKEYQHQISLWLERQRQSAFVHHAGESSVKEIPIVK
jgi:peptidyl-prolyl cis-trans isomerase SurA